MSKLHMPHSQPVGSAPRAGIGRAATIGATAGVAASVVMGMYAMVTSLLKDTGFFTPLHHIASIWAAPDAMMTSMEGAMTGSGAFEISAGAALLGAVIHMLTGAAYGAVFGVLAARARVGAGLLAVAGLAWGAVVLVVSAFVGLPLAAALFNAGDPIANMAEMAGWWTFTIEHLVYGVVLGLLYAVGSRRGTAAG